MNLLISNDTKREKWQPSKLLTIIIACGIISSIIYVITDISASVFWRDYNHITQVVSELIAVNAPTRPYVTALFIIYSLLIYAFGAGIWLSTGNMRALRIAAVFIIGKELLGLAVTLFFPIHLRGVEGNYSDIMHGILTAAGVFLCMFPAMIAGAAAFKGKFRIYSIITMIVFLGFGILTGLAQPNYTLNMPTPMMGVWERINIYGYLLWITIFSVLLLRFKRMSDNEGAKRSKPVSSYVV